MKVPVGQLEKLRALVALYDTSEVRAAYVAGEFPRAELVKDLDKRYRWDLFYAARRSDPDLLSGFSMAHIDTALRHVVPVLLA